MQFQNKLQKIEAVFYDGSNKHEIEKFINNHCAEYNDTVPFICWHENGMSYRAYFGEYIVKFPNGKIIPIWNEIFNQIFEPINN